MNLAELERKLIATARNNPPGDHVPYAFEKRILARLTERPPMDLSGHWARALWRAAASCVAVTMLLAAWSFLSPAERNSSKDLSQQFENTLLAAVDQEGGYF
jgi:hypothetical protein